jgi:predicted nucleotidyltransferase
MGTQHKKVSVAHFHALRLHRGSVKRIAQRKHVHIEKLFYIPRPRLRVGIDEVPRQTGPGELSTLVSAGTAHETAQERTARAGVGDRQHARL